MYRRYESAIMEAKESSSLKLDYAYLSELCGLKVSNLCLGAMTFGQVSGVQAFMKGQANEPEAHALLDRFEAAGGNFVDTANVYSNGKSEEIIGNWMKKRQNRENMVVATKCRFNSDTSAPNMMDDPVHPNRVGLNRKNIIRSVEDSLERLQTDYIDLYQIHHWDDATPLKEILQTLEDLVRGGKVRYVGACNLTGWQLQKILCTNQYMGFDQWVTLQQQYNLLCRGSELEAFEVCKRSGVGVMPYSPLSFGLLTDKVKASRESSLEEGSRVASMRGTVVGEMFGVDKRLQSKDFWSLLDTIEAIGKEHNKTIAQVSLRWLLQKKPVTSVIIGVKNLTQLESNMGASSGWQLTDEQMARLDEASAPVIPYPYDQTVALNLGRQRNLPAQY